MSPKNAKNQTSMSPVSKEMSWISAAAKFNITQGLDSITKEANKVKETLKLLIKNSFVLSSKTLTLGDWMCFLL